jgi:hypothetical protein
MASFSDRHVIGCVELASLASDAAVDSFLMCLCDCLKPVNVTYSIVRNICNSRQLSHHPASLSRKLFIRHKTTLRSLTSEYSIDQQIH